MKLFGFLSLADNIPVSFSSFLLSVDNLQSLLFILDTKGSVNKRTHRNKFTNIDIRSRMLHLGRKVGNNNDRSFFAILKKSSGIVVALQAYILVGGDVDDACYINALFVFLDAA